MPKVIRLTLLSLRDLAVTAGPFVLLALALIVLAYWVLDPTPPRTVVLATGVDQGAYAEFGRRYAAILKRHGIDVQLKPTQGAAENLTLLRDERSGVDIAFAQGGAEGERRRVDGEVDDERLVSLGSLFHEPVWLFYREEAAQRLLKNADLTGLPQLVGWRVNLGAPGSGVAPLFELMLQANRVDPASLQVSRQALTPAVVEFLEGRLDALVVVSAPESLMVQLLLQSPGIKLASFPQAEAYARRFPFMSRVTLPRGVVELARDVPPADVRLVAPTATLVARSTLHPALQQLFVQAAVEVHSGPGWFQRKGDFPNAENTDRPVAAEAQRVYKNGVPWLQRYLPFWAANLADRMWVALLAIVAVLIPLSRVLPPLYEFRIRSRVFRWYGQLRAVEESRGERPVQELLRELDDIEQRAHRVQVPLSYADELYALRSHIQLVRRRLQS
jgi:TRAP-type uncharacterized transport system substrate-binding protein